ncbi:MAG: hypothetical protein WAL63_11295, partial [Solirubrobacteraceae bacterium]
MNTVRAADHAAAVAAEAHVGIEQLKQGGDIAVLGGGQECFDDPALLVARRRVARPARLHCVAGPRGELTRRLW